MTHVVRPLRHLLDERRPLTYGIVQAGDHVPDGVPYIRPIDMTNTQGVHDPDSLQRTDPSIAAQYRRSSVRSGDVVMSIGPSFGKVMTVPVSLEGANLTQGTARLAPGRDLDARWLYWFLQSAPAQQFWDASVAGATFRSLNLGPLGETPVPTLPVQEQRKIADFLDDQVSLIHTVMEARDRQNALLRLELQTEISELVLGAESRRVQLRRVIQRRPDYGANAAAEFEKREWPRFIRTTDISADGGLREETFRSLPPEVAEDYLLEDGDVLFTRSGSVGKSFIYRRAWGPAAFAGYLIRVSTDRSRLLPEWLKAFAETDSYWAQIRESAIQSTIPNVNAERYSGLMLPVPPLIEQAKRIVHIQRVQEVAQARIDVLDRSRRLMEELRVAMITAAVMGELDVTTARRGAPT